MPDPDKLDLVSLQADIRNLLQGVIESGDDAALVFLFQKINQFAWEWINEKPRKLVSQEMTCLFSAASALLTRRLHTDADANFLSKLVDVLESSQKESGNYGMEGLDVLPTNRLQITATGGERGCRTLYVTIATGLICSHYLPTVVQGNYSVTGCNCGAFAESDMMEHLHYRLGSSEHDIMRLKEDRFAYLHVQRYQPILKVFCAERGALGFRDMMKLAVVLADPFRCDYQYIGVWDKEFMLPMARALVSRKCVKKGVVVASDHLDEFTDSAAVTIENKVQQLNDLSLVKVIEGSELKSADRVEDECMLLRGFFAQDWEKTDEKLELVLQNAALALAACHAPEFLVESINHIKSWRKKLLNEQNEIKQHCLRIVGGWESSYGGNQNDAH